MSGLEVYLVGGAVRDRLLGRPVTERDWVVVGATPESMLDRGFRPVGRDFPVFLHPDSHEEYALARTERKTGPGYHGFTVHAAPQVTLEQDLQRRDLTVNAMAQTPDGQLVDPMGGREDLLQRTLRHVSEAFAEDPVRILRLARFTARYAPLGFRPANETMRLCCQMVSSGEVDNLVPERVWQEWSRALMESCPQAFLQVLKDCGALHRLAPALANLLETDAGERALGALTEACHRQMPLAVRFAVLTADLCREQEPTTAGNALQALCQRYRVPQPCAELAQRLGRWHDTFERAPEAGAEPMLSLLEAVDGFRQGERFDTFLLAAQCRSAAAGDEGVRRGERAAGLLQRARDAAAPVTGAPFAAEGLSGPAIGQAVRKERLRRIEDVVADHRNQAGAVPGKH
nr:multifunctional CCA tRNA nucleotidyl transferase/2'3'-cyclic phosphodiesterase/2'nucleotidase/phosphatase [Methylonatrum kenyense]